MNMNDSKVEDVVRHFSALSTSVRTEPDLISDKNVVRVLSGLRKALSTDGFDLSKCDAVSLGDSILPGAVPPTTQALLVSDTRDAAILEALFTKVPGWKTRRFVYRSKTFVIISNAARLTEKRVKESLKSYILNKKVDDEHARK